ncbi:SCO family protein [Halopenitus sp. H-Gu1]|uniref:SCO family protein n=1 Tax=Halopenitus sp. H-Gu1 TaxID=3242697 RepID=UPI00359E0253
MRRRSVLSGIATGTTMATAGCLSGVFEDHPDDVVLDPQEDQRAESGELAYPAYGEPLPAFQLPDPLTGTAIDTGSVDETMILTTFFASCPAECGILLNRLASAQAILNESGLANETLFLAITFDPDRDDAEMLRENAARIGADLEAGNWRYLRPQSPEAAERIVEDQLGIGFERDVDSPRVPGYDFTHSVLTLLVNPEGIVERAYRGETLDLDRVTGDVEAVVEKSRDDA